MTRFATYSLLLSSLALLLASCSSTQPRSSSTPPSNPNAGRYSIAQDRAPTRELDIAAIPEVVPEPFVRTGAGNRSPYTVLGKSYHVMPSEEGYSERGIASWYGEKFHGHKTSNGEVFDMYQSSAAHKALPIPSFLNVTNLDNNRSIIVRVNDRGPFHGDRLIDLSYAAAVKLGFADRGTARVQLDAIIPDGAYSDVGRIVSNRNAGETLTLGSSSGAAIAERYLQVAAFSDADRAQQLSDRLRSLTDHPVFIRSVNSNNQRLHRVRIGPINSDSDLARISASVVAANLGSPYTITE